MENILDEAFGISPDTVFRVLTGFLTIAVIALWRALRIERKSRNRLADRLMTLAEDNVGALRDINSVLQSIKEVAALRGTDIRERIDNLDGKLESWFSRIESILHP